MDGSDEGDCVSIHDNFVTGMPLGVVSWDEINMDDLQRMNATMLRSAILQACSKLHALRTKSGHQGVATDTLEAAPAKGYCLA